MDKLPDKVVRFDVVQVEYGKAKMCQCYQPHYEVDYRNRLVYCKDCGAIVDPFEALVNIAKDAKRMSDFNEAILEERRQIMDYHPRRVILKQLEQRYVGSEKHHLEPTCPCCGEPFPLARLLETAWCNPAFVQKGRKVEKE